MPSLKTSLIWNWKNQYKILDFDNDNYKNLYDKYLNATNCDKCGCDFGVQGDGTGTFKCLDHDHKTGLFRNFLCNTCNSKTDRELNSNNTSGHTYIYYVKAKNRWAYIREKPHFYKSFKTKEEAIAFKTTLLNQQE